jgi:hypothetical protein
MNERRVLCELVKTKTSPTSTSNTEASTGVCSVSGEELFACWLSTLNGNFNQEDEEKKNVL